MSSLAKKTISGATLTLVSSVATALTQAVILVILARLLSPVDYGRFAIATIASRFTIGIANGVLERALLTSEKIPQSLNPIAPFILSAVVAIICSIGALFLISERGNDVFMAVCIIQLAALPVSLSLTTRVALRRDLNLKPIVISEYMGQLLGLGLTTITLAALGLGVVSLAIGSLVQGICQAAIIFAAKRPSFATPLRLSAMAVTVRESLLILPNALLEVAFVQLPSIIVGWRLGVESLGLFTRIYSLVQLPIEMVATAITRVLVSALVQTRKNVARSKKAVSILITSASAILLPTVGGLIGSHEQFIMIVLGSSWSEGSQFSAALMLSTCFAVLAHLFAVFSEANAMYIQKALVQSCALGIQIITMIAGSESLGLLGASIGVAVGTFVFLLGNIKITTAKLSASPRDVYSWLSTGAIAGIANFLVSSMIGDYLIHWSVYWVLTSQIAACGVTTAVFLTIFERKRVMLILEIARGRHAHF